MPAETHVGIRVKCPSLLPDLIEIGMCRRVLVHLPNTEFHEQQMKCSPADKQASSRVWGVWGVWGSQVSGYEECDLLDYNAS
jgi:hypothetical protein